MWVRCLCVLLMFSFCSFSVAMNVKYKPIKEHSNYLTSGSSAVMPLSFDYGGLDRSFQSILKTVKVNLFTGAQSIVLPLINIQGNDGLPLRLTLKYSQSTPRATVACSAPAWTFDYCDDGGEIIRNIGLGANWSDYVGIINSHIDNIMFSSFPVFEDPFGKAHELYPVGSNRYQSKDFWRATLKQVSSSDDHWSHMPRFQGIVYAPNGTQYKIMPGADNMSEVTSIQSPNGNTTLNYKYNGSLLQSITSNNGFQLIFNYNETSGLNVLSSIQASDGREWLFGYSSVTFFRDNRPSLSGVTLPNQSHWNFTWKTFNIRSGYSMHDNFTRLSKIVSPNGSEESFTFKVPKFYMLDWGDDGVAYGYLDRLVAPYVASRVLSSVNAASSFVWNYTYEVGQIKKAEDYAFGGTTTVVGPYSKHIYTMDSDTDRYITCAGEDPYHLSLIYLTVPAPLTGKLLSDSIYDLSGKLLEKKEYTWNVRKVSSSSLFQLMGQCPEIDGPFDWKSGVFSGELTSKKITRYGGGSSGIYTTTYSDYDQYGYPGKITESSLQGSKATALTYYENPDLWIFKLKSKAISDADGSVVDKLEKTFDDHGNVLTEDKNGVTTTYTYNEGNLASKTDALGNTTAYADYVAGYPEKITNALGNIVQYDISNNGLINSKTDSMGNKISYTYGPLYRLTGIAPPEGLPIDINWNDTDNGTVMIMKRGDVEKIVHYTPMNHVSSIVNTDVNGDVGSARYFKYDGLERLISETYPTSVGNQSAPAITYAYDAINRPILISQVGKYAETLLYNDANNSVDVTDPNGNKTTYTYRSFGDPSQKQLMSIVQPNGVKTSVARTLLGDPLSITQGNFTRTFGYDDHHYLISKNNPEIGKTTYKRDFLGRLVSKSINGKLESVYSYDALGRLKVTSFTTSSGASETLERAYNKDGRMTEVSNSDGANQWSYQYDANGNCTSKALSVGDNLKFLFKLQYDGNDHLSSLTYPNNIQISYVRDGLGRVKSIGSYVKDIAYFPNNEIKSFSDGGGAQTNFTEENRGILNGVSVNVASKDLLNKQYAYDGNGNVLSIVDAINNADLETFVYDSNNRLVSTSGPWGSESFTYDRNNNMLTKSIGKSGYDYHYDPSTNLLSSISGAKTAQFAYKDGMTAQYNDLRLSYNSLNQLEAVSGDSAKGNSVAQEYSYDGNGNLYEIEGKQSLKYKIYNKKSQLLYSASPTSGDVNDYIYLGGKAVVNLSTQSGKVSPVYLHHDLLGSVIAKTDNVGKITYTDRFTPYGESLSQNDQSNDIGYAGKSSSVKTGLSYYGARFYSPELGRFLSPDPSPVKVNEPITFNRYIYAGDNPVSYKDNNGKWIVGALINTALGGLIGFYDTGSMGGAIKGAAIGFMVGLIDPLASGSISSLVARFTTSFALSAASKYSTSVAINTAGNVLYSKSTHHASNFLSSLFGGMGSVGIGHFFGSIAHAIGTKFGLSDSSGLSEASSSLASAPASGGVSNFIGQVMSQSSGSVGSTSSISHSHGKNKSELSTSSATITLPTLYVYAGNF